MLTHSYVSSKFAEKLADKIIYAQEEDVMEFLNEIREDEGFYSDFDMALYVAGVFYAPKNIYKFAIKNMNNGVNPDDKFFRVRDGVITSSNYLIDLCRRPEIKKDIVKAIKNCNFGHGNWMLANEYLHNNDTKNPNGTIIYPVGELNCHIVAILQELIVDSYYLEEDICYLLEELGCAYIKKGEKI